MKVSGAPPAKEGENAFWDGNKIYHAFWYGTDDEPPVWVYLVGFTAIFIVIWFFAWPSSAVEVVVYLVGLFPLLGLLGWIWSYLQCRNLELWKPLPMQLM